MSRSFKKTIAWGKSTASKATRSGHYGWSDCRAKKDKKNGMPVYKSHQRYILQSKEDYIEMVRQGIANTTSPFSKEFHKWHAIEWHEFLGDREPTEELIREFGSSLYKKDRSR